LQYNLFQQMAKVTEDDPTAESKLAFAAELTQATGGYASLDCQRKVITLKKKA
jgi:phenylpyruvate tautomerase PptA (4-oxalocrotonate tautomerase family)